MFVDVIGIDIKHVQPVSGRREKVQFTPDFATGLGKFKPFRLTHQVEMSSIIPNRLKFGANACHCAVRRYRIVVE